jgi:hypothetical protein
VREKLVQLPCRRQRPLGRCAVPRLEQPPALLEQLIAPHRGPDVLGEHRLKVRDSHCPHSIAAADLLVRRQAGHPWPHATKPKPTRIAAIYLYGADVAEHRAMLEALATAHAWQILETHHDIAASRPELKKLQASVMAANLDVVMVADLNQRGNGVLQVIETAAWLDAQRVHLYSINRPLDTGTTDGLKQPTLIRQLASYQSDIRRKRQRARKPRKSADGPRRKPIQ